MATYVLVHGGGHGGWCYQFVAKILRSAGHEVYTPTLTGLGERSHLLDAAVDLELHITDIVKVLEFEDLRDVILVGHSYGGMVITGVADRAGAQIGNLVYLDAAYPQNGESLVDHAGEIMLAARALGRVVDGIELLLFPGDDPMSYYGVTDPDQIAWMKSKLTPHPWRCFEQKLVLRDEAAMRRIPQSFISCTYRMDDASRVVQRSRSEGRYWEIDTGHDLMISEPAATAAALLEVAKGMPASTVVPVRTVAAAAPEAVAARRGSIEGSWSLAMKGPTGPMPSTLTIERRDGAWQATQSIAGTALPIGDFTFEEVGGAIRWVGQIEKPMKMKLHFSGVVAGDQMSGKVKAGFVGSYPFTGTRA